jgi:hypothetical protein
LTNPCSCGILQALPGVAADQLRDIACDCTSQQPVRARVGDFSLLVCANCDRLVIDLRSADDLDALREMVDRLTTRVAYLTGQLAREEAAQSGPTDRPTLRLVREETASR